MARDAIERIIRREWASVPIGPLKGIKAQLNDDGRRLLFYLARTYCRGEGAIIDGGAFLGGSAICMALGLVENDAVPAERKIGAIHSFDLFVAGAWIADSWFPEGRPSDGASFRPLYEANLGELLRYVTIHQGDIGRGRWEGGPIELLFLDLCSTIEASDQCTRIFFPRLIPGRSIVVQKGYLVESWNIWIYATMELLKDHFELVATTGAAGAVYLCTRAIAPEDAERALFGPLRHKRRVTLAMDAAGRWTGDARGRIDNSIRAYLDRVEQSGRHFLDPARPFRADDLVGRAGYLDARLNRRGLALDGVDLANQVGLEIGPLDAPMVRKTDGEIYYLDVLSSGELRRRYEGDPHVDAARIVDIDFVSPDGDMAKCVAGRKFDYVVSCHSFEHIPDLIGWLRQIDAVTRPDARIALCIPDKRFTFDKFRQITQFCHVYADSCYGLDRPNLYQVLDQYVNARIVELGAAWRRPLRKDECPAMYSEDYVAATVERWNAGEYVDVHCHTFTPRSFVDLLGELIAHDLTSFHPALIHDTHEGTGEFFVQLRKGHALPKEARLEACRRQAAGLEDWDEIIRERQIRGAAGALSRSSAG